MLSTDRKGAIAEAEIAATAIKMGIDVYRPLQEGGRYDLIFDLGEHLLRVQCKWAVRAGDVVVIRCYSSRRALEGMRVRKYTATEVDAIIAYCAEVDRCFVLLPQHFVGRRQLHLRLAPSRNNQREGINWANDFTFEHLQSMAVGP
jgi:hypothetical protein